MKNCNAFLVLIAAVVCAVTCVDASRANIVYPCGSSISADCVRQYFDKHGDCDAVYNPNPYPVYQEYLPFFVPKINVTVVAEEAYLTNFDGIIERFYKDKSTGNLVISINFKGLVAYGQSYFSISQKGKEPKVVLEDINVIYPTVLTADIPAVDGITVKALKKALITAFFPNNNARFYIGPKFSKSKDPVIKAAYKEFLADVPTVLQEIFLTQAIYFFLAYIDNNICYFAGEPRVEPYDSTVISKVNGIDIENRAYRFEPCAGSNDIKNCARNFFSKTGKCSIVQQDPQEPIYREKGAGYISSQNFSALSNDIYVSGLDGNIREFYFNTETSNLIISVDFPSFEIYSKLTDIFFYKRGKEPAIVSDSLRLKFDVTLTAVIPIVKKINKKALKASAISAHFPYVDADWELGPNFLNSKDPQVRTVIGNLGKDRVTIAKELFQNGATYYFLTYLQEFICDFGIPVNSTTLYY